MICLFAAIGIVGAQVAWRAPTTFESLLAAGITAWLISQVMINVGAVAGLLPVTGVPLPFISYGGTSLIIVLFATGLLANVARRCSGRGRRCGRDRRAGYSGEGPGGPRRPRRVARGPGSARPMTSGTWAVIAGGGTGGHLYPGIAVAGALVERGHDPATLRFVGARRGVEAKARALDGFPVTLLPGRGLVRRAVAKELRRQF